MQYQLSRKTMLFLAMALSVCGSATLPLSNAYAYSYLKDGVAVANGDTYLGYDLPPIRPTTYTKTGKCALLGHSCEHGFSITANTGRMQQAVFKLEGKYKRFRATVGIADTYRGRGSVSFTVSGIDKSGHEVARTRFTSNTLSVSQKPIDIDVPVANVEELSLAVKADDVSIPVGNAWWGNARLTTGAQGNNGPDAPDNDNGDKFLRLNREKYKTELTALAERIKTKFSAPGTASKPTLAVALFSFAALPGQALASKNAVDIQDDLRVALYKTDTFDLTVSRESFTEVLKQNKLQLGDTFNETTRAELGKIIAAQYLLLGRISDREDHVVVTIYLYNLMSGISRVDDSITIPLLTVSKNEEKDTPQEGDAPQEKKSNVTLSFTKESKFLVSEYTWVFDDPPSTINRPFRSNARPEVQSLTPGAHKIQLQWSGRGYYSKSKKSYEYEHGTIEFEAPLTEQAAKIQVNVQVSEGFGTKLDIDVRLDGKHISSKWHP